MNGARCVLLLAVLAGFAHGASGTTYDASLGALPSAQGWSLIADGENPEPFVSDGLLRQGPTSYSGYQFWAVYGGDFDFHSPVPLVLRARLKIDSSSYGQWYHQGNLWWRTGLDVGLSDIDGHWFRLGIADGGVRLSNASLAAGTEFIPFDTTGGLNTYELRISRDFAHLYVNGVETASLGCGPAESSGSSAYFGDGTSAGTGQFRLDYVNIAPVPEPLTLAAMGLGLAGLCRYACRRRGGVVRQ